ncbi:hypothetical protein EDD16DRAFT_1709836 [Pisolithus croceorrhizus]|nr:hypothetical protein EDD16DRAFT_1709836 [Pisolithus croceorrhizus]KAI6114920.1 hypothetical protein EV401DRAFT_2073866 [Pisolithus croceorrhizus]KAI6163787.1 hypothetical protein EDD17DRAFT_1755886 [Pisolithus thermaeus]
MSRRFTPHIFAGLLGVITGIYIFKPAFDQAAANKEGLPCKEDAAKSTSGGTSQSLSAQSGTTK